MGSDINTRGVNGPASQINGATRLVGVFGFPVEHSLSPAMHNAAFAALNLPFVYLPFRVPPEQLKSALLGLSSLGIVGVNLTIPHKQAALSLVDIVTDEAAEVGAVNTVHCTPEGLVGDNTDGLGFYTPLKETNREFAGTRALVLGAGGAARSVVFRLAREGVAVALLNRTLDHAAALAMSVRSAGYEDVSVLDYADTAGIREALHEASLVVNTTRVGMFPESDGVPELPLEKLSGSQLVYDLVYNPVKTRLLEEAEKRGCETMTGVKMLVYQGAAAFERWTGMWPPTAVMESAVLRGLE